MTTLTLTVPQSQIDRGTAMTGPLDRVQAALQERENILWLRGNGSARLFWKDGAKVRQKTWARFMVDRTR